MSRCAGCTTQHVLASAGTPLQNSLSELFSLLNLLMPHVFSDDQEFQAFFEATDSSDTAAVAAAAQLTEEESLLVASRFHQILAPFMLRRLKDQVMAGLAPKVWPRLLHLSDCASGLGGSPM